MKVTVHPINHYNLILDNDDKRKGPEVIETFVKAEGIRTLDGKWQYGRTTDGRRSVNFIGLQLAKEDPR